jgi:glyoxylase-like metal-dependent hydrolase (beta-lactamase superfamily II)
VAAPQPIRVNVRAYQVGFGDAVLASFTYAEPVDKRKERHLLFDFGSSHGLTDLGQSYEAIAEDIGKRTQGPLDVLVVTHRHKDHLSAFANE